MDNVLDNMPLETLNVAKQLTQHLISKLQDGIVSKQDEGKFGIFLGDAIDDPGKREIQIFETMRNELKRNANGTKTSSAVSKFVDKGVKVKDGELIVNEKQLKTLHKDLSVVLGKDVASGVTKDIKSIIEKQWLATKKAVDKSVKQYNRAVKQGLTKTDNRLINVLNNSNNFFISGAYDQVLVNHVNDIVAMHVREGLPKNKLAKEIKAAIGEQIPERADFYYKVLSNDVLNRARTTAQVESYVEARIRRYQIFAVLDERTTPQCEYMDGRIFEVEVARKIVTDTQSFGVPTSEVQAENFKALKPWIQFDEERATGGKNALYFRDAKGNRTYLPNSKFKGGADGFNFKGKKSDGVSTAIQDLGGKNTNPPMLPPFHANCRTTTVVDEEDIREQIASEEVGPGELPSSAPKFKPAKSASEAEDWMMENLINTAPLEELNIPKNKWKAFLKEDGDLNTKGISLDVLNSFNKQMFDMKNKHNLPLFDAINNRTKDPKTIASFTTNRAGTYRELNINADFIAKIKKQGYSLQDYVKQSHKDGFMAAKTVDELAYHEAAHYYQRTKPIPINKVEDAFQVAKDKGISVSVYGDIKATEFYAEAAVIAKRDGLKSFATKDLAEALEEILP